MSTFSIDVPNPAAAPSLQAQPVRAGVEGAAREASLALTSPGEGFDMGPLLQFGNDLLQPVLKKQQEAAFYQGVSRAAQGETAKDIEAERPAWASAFGDSSAVAGARYHEQISDSAALERRIIESLPQTRAMPPEEFAQHIRANVDALKTGDPTRDMILEGSALQFLPGALKMHARAHLDYNQKVAAAQTEQAVQQQIGVVETMAEQQRQNPAMRDDEAMQSSMFRMTSMLQVPDGVDPEAHFGRVANGLRSALSQGQFTSYTFLKQQGLLDKLPLSVRDNLTQLADASARKFVQENTPLDGRIAALNLATNYLDFEDPAKLMGAVDKLNSQIRAATGIPADFIPQSQKDNLYLSHEAARKAAAGKALTANEKAAQIAQEQQNMATVTQLLLDPRAGPGAAVEKLGLLPADSQAAVLNGAWAQTQTLPPAQQIAAQQGIAARARTIPVSAGIAAANATNSAVWSAQTDFQARLVTGMDPAALGKYAAAGADPDLFAGYLTIRKMNPEVDPATAWTSAKQGALLKKNRDPMNKVSEASLVAALEYANQNQVLGMRNEVLFGTKAQVGVEAVMPWVRKTWADSPGMSGDRAATAVSYAHAQGVRYEGGIAFVKADNRDGAPEWDDPKYFPGLGKGAKRDLLVQGLSETFKAATARDKNFDADNVISIFQQPDMGGKLAFSVLYFYKGQDGLQKQASLLIGQDEIKANADKAIKTRDDKTRAEVARFQAKRSLVGDLFTPY